MVAVFYFKLILNKINKKYANAPVINTNKMKKYMNGKDFIANEPENCHIFSVANEWL